MTSAFTPVIDESSATLCVLLFIVAIIVSLILRGTSA